MGFSIKLAPGVRVRASSRGLRTSLGPRSARVHVGGGRSGFSSNVGPVGFYTSLGGGRRRGSGGGRGASHASYQRQLAAQQRQTAQAQRAEEAQHLAQTFLHILTLHRVDFPGATRPTAPAPQQPDRSAIYKHYEKHALAGIGLFKRAARSEAKRQAAAWTDGEVQRRWAEACTRQAQHQQSLDVRWQQLCANQPDVLIETLGEAFDDNEAPAAAVDVEGSEVSLVLLVPLMEEIVPERMPTTTAAGNLSLRKVAQRDRAGYYKQLVCGQVLVTVRETLAVAPAIMTTRTIVLRSDGQDAYGQPRVSCLLAARFDRNALAGVRWESADAVQIVNDVAVEKVFNEKGRAKELTPLDLAAEPAIAQLIQAVDIDDLAER